MNSQERPAYNHFIYFDVKKRRYEVCRKVDIEGAEPEVIKVISEEAMSKLLAMILEFEDVILGIPNI